MTSTVIDYPTHPQHLPAWFIGHLKRLSCAPKTKFVEETEQQGAIDDETAGN